MAAAKGMTKTEIITHLHEKTELSKKQIGEFFEVLAELVKQELTGRGRPGVITIPNLVKIQKREKPATKAKMGRNPKTGEPMEIPARPKRKVVKAAVLSNVKKMVEPSK